MIFEFDLKKSTFNKEKHGIDFEEARRIWNDEDVIELSAQHKENEDRFLVIGKYKGKIWASIITYRDGIVRIISVRRARKKEADCYEENQF